MNVEFEVFCWYDNELKALIKAFNNRLITFEEMCELNLLNDDKVKINSLKEQADQK